MPTAHPTLSLAKEEALSIGLRIRSINLLPITVELPQSAPPSWKLTRDDLGYWLSIALDGSAGDLTATQELQIKTDSGIDRLRISLTVKTISDDIVTTPTSIDFGSVALSAVKTGNVATIRFGVRKRAGEFRVKSVSSTLKFLKPEARVVVEGRNYLVLTSVDTVIPPTAGSHVGVIRVETDDPRQPFVEVPCRITVVNQ